MSLNNKLLFQGKQVALFSDLHIGVHRDSPVWHDIALKFADWFVDVLNKRDIKDIVFCGDYFHTRHEIVQTSLQCGVEFLSKLKNFNLHMIPGNHCCYFKNNATVHSLQPFKEWSNVTVYNNVTTLTCNDKTFTFCPWGNEENLIDKCDVLFGHFEIVNFKMNTFKVCEHGTSSEDLLRKGNKVITGHFHLRDHRIYDNSKEVLYLGSPYQMDYGERGQDKGVTLLNTDTLEFEFIKNQQSPLHIKIKLSDLLEKNEDAKRALSCISGNFICIVIDVDIEREKLDLIISRLNNFIPAEIRIDYNTFQEYISKEAEQVEVVGIDIYNSIQNFVEIMSTNTDKQSIVNTVNEIYQIALNNNE